MITFELCLHRLEEFFRDNRLMFALIPVTAFLWVLERAVIEGVLQNDVDVAERQILVALAFEVEVELEPVMRLPS